MPLTVSGMAAAPVGLAVYEVAAMLESHAPALWGVVMLGLAWLVLFGAMGQP